MSDKQDMNPKQLMLKTSGTQEGNGDSVPNFLESPLSPSSVFTKSVIADSDGSMVNSILLSVWDNILGPKIQHLWTSQNGMHLQRDVLGHIASLSLNGEICRDPLEKNIDMKFYKMAEKEVIVTAFVFSAMGKMGMSVFSLALMMQWHELKAYLTLHELCVSWTNRLISKLRILIEQKPKENVFQEFTKEITPFIQMLKSLRETRFPSHISVKDTYFSLEHKMDETFLRKAVASHLMTLGHSVVIGHSANKVNLMLNTLGLFLSPKELCCSRIVTGDVLWPYHMDISLQGILKESNGQFELDIQELLCSKYPSSVIDISNKEVLQSPPCHEHAMKRYETLKEELSSLWANRELSSPAISAIFMPGDYPETLVQKFILELSQLPTICGVKESYVEQFVRLLERKAVTFIKYLETETNRGKSPIKSGLRKVRQDLGIILEGDFRIILATAEKLKPGICGFLFGDPKMNSEQMQSLLETL